MGVSILCGYCFQGVDAQLVAGSGTPGNVAWLKCPLCNGGSVRAATGVVYPPAPAGGNVRGLPPDVAQAWTEVRAAFSIGAYTASEMMSRKILMHVAVDVAGLPEGKTFGEYVDGLESTGYITTGLKTTVDSIRSRGNAANHDLPASSEDEAHTTLSVTEYLLRGVYEMPDLVPQPPP